MGLLPCLDLTSSVVPHQDNDRKVDLSTIKDLIEDSVVSTQPAMMVNLEACIAGGKVVGLGHVSSEEGRWPCVGGGREMGSRPPQQGALEEALLRVGHAVHACLSALPPHCASCPFILRLLVISVFRGPHRAPQQLPCASYCFSTCGPCTWTARRLKVCWGNWDIPRPWPTWCSSVFMVGLSRSQPHLPCSEPRLEKLDVITSLCSPTTIPRAHQGRNPGPAPDLVGGATALLLRSWAVVGWGGVGWEICHLLWE